MTSEGQNIYGALERVSFWNSFERLTSEQCGLQMSGLRREEIIENMVTQIERIDKQI